jgi:hypothetical protein
VSSALRVTAVDIRGANQLVITLLPVSSAVFSLPSPAMGLLRSRVCDSVVYVKTLHWRIKDRDGRPRLTSNLPLLSNLTTLELLAKCNGVVRQVSRHPVHPNVLLLLIKCQGAESEQSCVRAVATRWRCGTWPCPSISVYRYSQSQSAE